MAQKKNKAAVSLALLRRKRTEEGLAPSYEEMGKKGGANSRKYQADGGRSLGQKAVGARWARVHAEKKRADKRYVVPEKYREAVAALLKGK